MTPNIVTLESVTKWFNDAKISFFNGEQFNEPDPRGEFPDSEMNYLNSFYSFKEQKWKLK